MFQVRIRARVCFSIIKGWRFKLIWLRCRKSVKWEPISLIASNTLFFLCVLSNFSAEWGYQRGEFKRRERALHPEELSAFSMWTFTEIKYVSLLYKVMGKIDKLFRVIVKVFPLMSIHATRLFKLPCAFFIAWGLGRDLDSRSRSRSRSRSLDDFGSITVTSFTPKIYGT